MAFEISLRKVEGSGAKLAESGAERSQSCKGVQDSTSRNGPMSLGPGLNHNSSQSPTRGCEGLAVKAYRPA